MSEMRGEQSEESGICARKGNVQRPGVKKRWAPLQEIVALRKRRAVCCRKEESHVYT